MGLINNAVNRLATRAAHPTEKDYKALPRVLYYLGNTIHFGIVFNPGSTADMNRATRLFCYVDAAYVTHQGS